MPKKGAPYRIRLVRPRTAFISYTMKDWIIEKLGGYTKRDWELMQLALRNRIEMIEDLKATNLRLQALVPVSAVTPKKRGRPRKVDRMTYISRPSMLSGPSEKIDINDGTWVMTASASKAGGGSGKA